MYALYRSSRSKPRTLVDAFLHVHQQSNTNIDINEYSLISLIFYYSFSSVLKYLYLVSDPPKAKKEKYIFEHMMDLVIAQLSVRSLWRSVSVLERRIRRSGVLSLLGTNCFSLSHPPARRKKTTCSKSLSYSYRVWCVYVSLVNPES